jgi:hypothetical protein
MAKKSVRTRSRKKPRRVVRLGVAKPPRPAAADDAPLVAAVGGASCDEIRKWVLAWFTRIKGRPVRATDTLKSLRYDDDADLGDFTGAFNRKFQARLDTVELKQNWKIADNTVGGLVDEFLCKQVQPAIA